MSAEEQRAPEPQDQDAEFDFSALNVKDQVAEVELPWVSPDCRLIVRPAFDVNKDYQKGVHYMSGKRKRFSTPTGKFSTAQSDRDREDDRLLFPKHVIVGWSGVQDRGGNPVIFSQAACRAFVAALPAWIFDRVRVFAMRPESFLEDDEEAPDPAELAGN